MFDLEIRFTPLVRSALLFASILLLIAFGVFLVRIFRGSSGHDKLGAHELLAKFREMHAKGDLSEEEFRTIKTKLKPEIEAELRDNEETG